MDWLASCHTCHFHTKTKGEQAAPAVHSRLLIAQLFIYFFQSTERSSSSFLQIVAECRIAGLLEGLVSDSPLSCCLIDHAVLFRTESGCLAWLAWQSSRSSLL